MSCYKASRYIHVQNSYYYLTPQPMTSPSCDINSSSAGKLFPISSKLHAQDYMDEGISSSDSSI